MPMSLAFEPVERIAGRDDGGLLLLCDHASPALPAEYGNLGLPPEAFARHIAYDIGAAWMTRHLARLFDAPAVLSTFSRLLIDPNRGADDPTLLMRVSDGAIIPGNAVADEAERERRLAAFWQPYRDAVSRQIEAMLASACVPAIVSMHSFTPVWRGAPRPWQVAALWDKDPRLALPFIQLLRQRGLEVGDNEPYDGALQGDTMEQQATQRGLAHVLVEVRQDLVATPETAHAWALRLAAPLRAALAQPQVHEVMQHGSRTSAQGRRETV